MGWGGAEVPGVTRDPTAWYRCRGFSAAHKTALVRSLALRNWLLGWCSFCGYTVAWMRGLGGKDGEEGGSTGMRESFREGV